MRVPFRSVLAAAAIAGALGLPSPAQAQQKPPADMPPFMAESLDKLMKALELIISAIPVYEPPVMTPEGDIVIRRRRGMPPPPPPSRPPAAPGDPQRL